jgi:hypothetical protein
MIRNMRILTLLVCGVMLSGARAADEINITVDDLTESRKILATIYVDLVPHVNNEFAASLSGLVTDLRDEMLWASGMLKILDVISDPSDRAKASTICAGHIKKLYGSFEVPITVWTITVNQGDQYPATITILASKLVDECRRMQAILKPVP